MKKHILMLAAICLAAAGCYEDKGNYDYTELGDFYVDVTDAETAYTRAVPSMLEIAPDLVFGGNRDDLTFSWRAYNDNGATYPLSEEENLSVSITMIPGNYLLEFRATENSTGRIATYRYDLTVESFSSGILVLYERDLRTDFAIVAPTTLFGDMESDAVLYDMFATINPDRRLEGAPVAIDMYIDAYLQYITLLTENDGVRLSPNDLSVTQEFAEWFTFAPATVKPQAYRALNSINDDYTTSDGLELLVNDGVAYSNMTLMAMLGMPVKYSERYLAGSNAAPFIFQGSGTVTAYDTNVGGFYGGSVAGGAMSRSSNADLANIGMELLHIDYGCGVLYTMCAIFRDGADHWFHVMDFRGNTLLFKSDISSFAGIGEASAFAMGQRTPAAFYASGGAVYRIGYNVENKTVTGNPQPAWNGLGSGEVITAMEFCTYPGRGLSIDTRERYLLVASYNESTREGKVYMLEVNIETDGSIDTEPAAVYEGFGRIKDFGFKY